MNTSPSLYHIFTLSEAASLWEIPYQKLRRATQPTGNKLQKTMRLNPEHYRVTSKATLIDYEGMTQIYGPEKHPIPKSQNYLKLSDVLTIDELAAVINRSPATIISVDIQGGYGKFASRFQETEWRKSGKTIILSRQAANQIYNPADYDIETGKFIKTFKVNTVKDVK